MNDKTKQFLDEQFRFIESTKQEKREATKDWCSDKLSREEFNRIMREHGPQWSRMYFAPQTPQQHAENDRELQEGTERVRNYLRENYPQVASDSERD